MFSFDRPILLILIPVIILIWFIFFREKIGHKLPNKILEKYLSYSGSTILLWFVRVCIVSVSISILAGPIFSHLIKTTESTDSHTVIILDISRSMLVTDIIPDRISSAKDTIHTFLTQRKGEKIGLILFAGKPFLSIPFTDDITGIQSIVSDVSPYTLHQEYPGLSGTAIGDALLLGVNTFSGVQSEHKNIILFTDGRANTGIGPRKVIGDIIQNNIHTYALGIGTLSGGSIPGGGIYEGSGGTSLDEGLLEEVSEKTGGKYFRITDSEKLLESLKDINTIMNAAGEVKIEQRSEDYRLIFVSILCLLIFIEYGLRRYIMKVYKLLE